ncbi:ribonuclease E/G [Hyphobacterium sp. HN65]|uniref:Ribonuclease E/G n=1 Tax=Hyphobacterium lacteum TaxID=3116575 RepID=A0ABU7LUJ1_9PROT|nr:ribonuclease E/G [Hyphobacterium sp. HN65]MEE2527214.1 ribonuclease E/G [Hyphobacterium sp. HN65]
MNRLIAVEEWVGETRAAIVENGKVVELHFERWSEMETRAHTGEVYAGRITRVDTSLNAAFVDLGRGEPGFLPFGKAGRPKGVHEGAAIAVRVSREAFAEKGPTLAFANIENLPEAPALIEADANLAERLLRRYPEADVQWADEAGIDIDGAIEAARDSAMPLKGGGSLHIEPTRALTAIDIDSGGRAVNAGRKLALDVNTLAMPEIARQIRLRGIGGNIVIDTLHMRAQPDRKAVEGALKKALKFDPARVDLTSISRFGLIEMVRQRAGRSVMEHLLGDDGQPTAETLALTALRRLQIEGTANRAARLTLRIAPRIHDWLSASKIGWQEAMSDRLGPRFELAMKEGAPPDFIEVTS